MPRSTTLIAAPLVRVSRTTLDPGEAIEWHHHTDVQDVFYPLTGSIVVSTRDPEVRHDLPAGEAFRVPRGTTHRVSNESARPVEYLLVQHGGQFDFHEDR
jgi:mannose-6-phosphate isomerase-like protein (cupin superfamily)